MATQLEKMIQRLEAVALKISAGGAVAEGEMPPSIQAYYDFMSTHMQPFVDACGNGGTKQLGLWTETAFSHIGKTLQAAHACAKPSPSDLLKFLDPVTKIIEAAGNPDRNVATFAQEKAFSEIIQCCSWVMMDGPKTVVLGSLEAADFYLMKVLTAAKAKGDTEKQAMRDYVKTSKTMLTELATYAHDFHKTGVVYKFGGPSILEWKPTMATPTPKSGNNSSKEDKVRAVLAKLEGFACSKGISLDEDAAAPAVEEKKEAPKPKKKAFAFKPRAGPPKVGKVDTSRTDKIFVDNYGPETEGPVIVTIPPSDKPKTGIFIGCCKGTVIKIEGKAKNITISGCQDCGIVFDECVTTVELINSKKCQVQALVGAGTFTLDKCDRTKVYLASESHVQGCLVYTSQSSATNIFFDSDDGEDMVEYGVPEQILSTFSNAAKPFTAVLQEGELECEAKAPAPAAKPTPAVATTAAAEVVASPSSAAKAAVEEPVAMASGRGRSLTRIRDWKGELSAAEAKLTSSANKVQAARVALKGAKAGGDKDDIESATEDLADAKDEKERVKSEVAAQATAYASVLRSVR